MSDQKRFWEGLVYPEGPINEECSFAKIDDEHGFYEHCLTIKSFYSDSQELISELEVIVFVNEECIDYIKRKSIYCESSLFLLARIRDMFLREKMVAAEYNSSKEYKFAEKDKHSNAIIYFIVNAKVYFSTGNPTILIANYANTHIKDQINIRIDQFISKYKFSPLREKLIKQFYYETNVENQLKFKQEQEKALKNLEESSCAKHIYIDETGDLSQKNEDSFYAICSVILDAEKILSVREDLLKIQKKYWPQSPNKIHFTKLANPQRRNKLEKVAKEFLNVLKKNLGKSTIMIIPNIYFLKYLLRCESDMNSNEERPISTDFSILLSKEKNGVNNKILEISIEEIISHLILCSLKKGISYNIIHDRKNKPWMNDALKFGFEHSREYLCEITSNIYGLSIVPEMNFQTIPSKEEPCLWLSDWLAWEIGNLLRGGTATDAFIGAQDIIEDIIVYDEEGKKTNYNFSSDQKNI